MAKRRINKTELREKIQGAISRLEFRKAKIIAATNPQVVKILHQTEGKIEALDTVLHALNGDVVFLNILCGE